MRLLFAVAVLIALAPLRLYADNYPYVQDGPVIVGVTDTDAWVVWYTSHHEGTGTECTVEEDTPLLGDHNTDTPTLTLSNSMVFTDSDCDRYHHVHLTGLTASTAYTFTLDKPWDEINGTTAAGAFTTAPAAGSGAGVTFVVYGDTRNDVALGGTDTRADHQAVVDAIIANEPEASFLVHTGDMALNITAVSGDDKGYTEFFAVERNLLANRPVFVVLGNHETIDTTFFDAMFDPARFASSPHPYYSSFDWGKVHFALTDSFEGSATTLGLGGLNPGISMAQTEWLDADLQAAHAASQTSFLGIHQGPYSYYAAGSSGHGGLIDAVIDFTPLMLRYGTLASFAGHDHYYERGHEGCIDYLVLGGGGAPMYAPDPTAASVIVAQESLTYMVVTAASDGGASMVVKNTSGNTIDTFTFVAPDANCQIPGLDAGTEDDAGVDAGSNDAGSNDAGSNDAGSNDAGSNDAGSNDAGSNDAGSNDGGVRDAGSGPDGGEPNELTTSGCGCNSTGDSMLEGFALILAFGLRYRRAWGSKLA